MSLYEHERKGNAQELVGVLNRSDNAEVRRRAAEALGRLDEHDDREDIVNALVGAVASDDADQVVAAAVDALDELGQEALETLLVELSGLDLDADIADWKRAQAFTRALDADMPELRMAAANALGELSVSDAVPELVGAFEDDDPRVRARAARACGNMEDPRATDGLQRLLEDPSGTVRGEAAEALGRIGNRQALQALLEMYDDENERVRRVAASALGNFSSARPIEHIVEALADEASIVRRTAVYSLIQLLSNAPTEQSHQIRETIVDELAERENDTVVDPLVEILRDGTQAAQRRNTAWLLGRVLEDDSNRDAVDALVHALEDGGKMTQQFAATSLAEIGGTYVENRLVELMYDEGAETEARAQAVFTLGKIGDEETAQEVKGLLDDTDDDRIRQRAFSALSKLGGANAVGPSGA
jgi:HEAT repeat protein